MDIKRFVCFSFYGLLLMTFSNFSGCRKLCHSVHYNFRGEANFYPEKDSITLGDTLWFSSSLPVQMKDINMNQIIDYSRASNISTQINFDLVSFANPTGGSVDSFVYLPIKGNLSTNPLSPHSAKTVTYAEKNGNYELTFGIVAQKKGVYAISIIDIQNSKKNCSDAYITLSFSNADKHQHYLETIFYPGSPYGDNIPPIEQTHTYCFKVY